MTKWRANTRANTKAKATPATPSPSMTDATKQSSLPWKRDSVILEAIRGVQTDIKALKTELLITIDAKIDDFAAKFREEFAKHCEETTSDIRARQAASKAHKGTMKELEAAASHNSDALTALERSVNLLAKELESTCQKCEDLEARSRRNNLRIVGIKEGAEGNHQTEFIATLIKDSLRLDDMPLLDHTHRARDQLMATVPGISLFESTYSI